MIKILNMIFAIGLIIITILISFVEPRISRKNAKKILMIIIFVLSMFLSYRHIGLDLEVYRIIFESQRVLSLRDLISGGLFTSQLEPFFVLLISFLKKYNFTFNHFLFLSGIIPMIMIYKSIVETEEKHILITFSLFLLMLFFIGPVDVVRHFFAAAIYLSAILSLSQKKKIRYWTKISLSVFVHYSNALTLLIYPILKYKWSKHKFFYAIAFTSIMAIPSRILLINISSLNFWDKNNVIIWKLGYYLTYYNSTGYQYLGIPHRVLLSIMMYFPLVFSFFITIMALNKVEKFKKSNFKHMLLSSQIIGILVAIFFVILNTPTLGMRLHFLLNIGSFFIVKEVIVINSNKKDSITYGVIILSLVFYNFIIVLYNAGIHNPMSPFYIF